MKQCDILQSYLVSVLSYGVDWRSHSPPHSVMREIIIVFFIIDYKCGACCELISLVAEIQTCDKIYVIHTGQEYRIPWLSALILSMCTGKK